jgi:hypothetical protein
VNEKMFNEGNQIQNFMSSSGSGTVINYGSGSGSEFLTSYGSSSGSGSTSQKVTVPTVPVPVPAPQHWIFYPSRIPDPGVKKAPDPGSATLQNKKTVPVLIIRSRTCKPAEQTSPP